MIQFSKTVIEGVSFDKLLFEKELRKLIIWFGDNEKQKTFFQLWCMQKYGNQYYQIIIDVFKNDIDMKKNSKVPVLEDIY